VFKDTVRVVILNACYSEEQAEAIAQHIDCVIGMTKAIGDEAAVGFASSFYQAIGYGRNIKDAFLLGCNQINIENLKEHDTPQLLVKAGCDPEEIVFAGRSSRKKKKASSKPMIEEILPPRRLTAKTFYETAEPKKVIRSIDVPSSVNNKVLTEKFEYHQGRTLQTLSRFEDAITHYDNALRINPKFYEAWCGKGASLHVLNSITRNKKLLSEAIECFNKASEIHPHFTEAWYSKGLCLAKLGVATQRIKLLHEAIDCFEKALKINPKFAACWYGKGIALDSLGAITHDSKLLNEAISCFDEALKINPKYAEALNHKALSEKTLRIWKEKED